MLCRAMLLLLGLTDGANSTMLVSSINTLLNFLQVNSSLLFTSHDTLAYIALKTDQLPVQSSRLLCGVLPLDHAKISAYWP